MDQLVCMLSTWIIAPRVESLNTVYDTTLPLHSKSLLSELIYFARLIITNKSAIYLIEVMA